MVNEMHPIFPVSDEAQSISCQMDNSIINADVYCANKYVTAFDAKCIEYTTDNSINFNSCNIQTNAKCRNADGAKFINVKYAITMLKL